MPQRKSRVKEGLTFRGLAELGRNDFWDQKIKDCGGDQVKILQVEADRVAVAARQLETSLSNISDSLKPQLAFYGISADDPDRWLVLAFYLAVDSGIFKKPGQKKKWDEYYMAQLLIAVISCRVRIAQEKNIAYEKVTVIRACRRLQSENQKKWGKKGTEHSLQNRYDEAMNSTEAKKIALEWSEPPRRDRK